jgi:phosphocarrier protein FPr
MPWPKPAGREDGVMIGIVLVSHSLALANAIRALVQQMVGPDFPVAVAAGVGDDHADIGTDAVHIAEVLQPFCAAQGAVVLMDLGSAVLSAQTALELLDAEGIADAATKIRLCPAPIVEAAIAAAVLANSGADLDAITAEAMGALAAKADQLGEVEPSAVAPQMAPTGADGALTFDVVIENPHGLHARPAASLVQTAAAFRSEIHLANLSGGRGPTSARSLTGIGLLQVRKGDQVRFTIQGEDAPHALDRMRDLAARHFGESIDAPPASPSPPSRPAAGRPIAVSDGVAIGRPLVLAEALPPADAGTVATPAEERARLAAALTAVAADIHHAGATGDETSAIFAAQALILSDPALIDAVERRLNAGGVGAAAAWQAEMTALADGYSAMDDDYLRARAADLRDISARVFRVLAGVGANSRIAPDPPAILLTDELLPSDAMACDPDRVLGILATTGSATAHAAIIARTRGIPMVVGQPGADSRVWTTAATLAIDGSTGEIWIDPDAPTLAMVQARQQDYRDRQAAFQAARTLPAVTTDGTAVDILANVGNADDAQAARDNGAEGVGLLRTEFVYLAHQTMPSEQQQVEALSAILARLGPGPVTVRTPDIGADKPLPFLPMDNERNPFLGVRGLRLSFRHPDFFRSNLRAILRAGLDRDLWIMVPMVSSPEEMRAARAAVTAAHDALAAEGVAHAWPVKIGMMVEVPSAALMADRFAELADFFSIGTNDLTQYVLAAERGNGALDALQDGAHPAVLKAVSEICAKAAPRGCHVSVCGDAASDPVTAALFIGAGVRSLSVRANQVGAIKALVRGASLAALTGLLAQARDLDNGAEVRRLAHATLSALGGPG